MKAVVITHSSPYESRAEAVGEFLQRKGYAVEWIYASFDHQTKQTRHADIKYHTYLRMNPYQKNLSVKRIVSLKRFGNEVEQYLDREMREGAKADLLYFMIPLNSFCGAAERLKAKYGAKIIIDVMDLWPESLPLKKFKSLPPFRFWSNLRDRHLGCADFIFTECDLYQRKIRLPADRTRTLYWFQERSDTADAADVRPADSGKPGEAEPSADGSTQESAVQWKTGREINLVYIGSINYIIDLELTGRILAELRKYAPVRVHIIGSGIHAEDFRRTAEENGCEAVLYGNVYDEKQKQEIYAVCDFGLNLMVPQVDVGLTMKSLEYLSHNLPFINDIGGDTWNLVEREGIGVNVDRNDLKDSCRKILRYRDQAGSREAVRACYERHFTREVFERTLDDSLKNIL